MKAYDIEWDTDDSEGTALPKEIDIPAGSQGFQTENRLRDNLIIY